jgi:drug/metabolite transporter (DMT)-like permease
MFWAFAGSQPAGYFLLLSKRIRKSFLDESKKMKAKGWTILFIGSVFYFIGIILLYVAISMQNVALVTAVGSAQPFFVFLYALALSVFRPGIVKEDLSKATLSMKIISCVLIILGSWLVVI